MSYPTSPVCPPLPSVPRGPSALRRFGWIAVLVIGAALFLTVERTLVATENPNFVPSAILLGAAVVPATFLGFVYGRRLAYRVSPAVIATATLLGGVIGTVAAGTLEFDAQRDLGSLPMIGVGLIEETCKLLVPLAVLVLLPRGRTRADGLLIGVAAGAGFAALETMGYAFTTLVQSHGSITDTVDVLLLRGLMSPAGHMAWTGIAAAALFAATEAGWTARRTAGFLGAFALAVALHALWDSRTTLTGTAVVAMVSLIALGWTVHRTAHVARASTWMADAGVPVHVLRQIAGHRSLATTQRHLHPDDRTLGAASDALSHHLRGSRYRVPKWSPQPRTLDQPQPPQDRLK